MTTDCFEPHIYILISQKTLTREPPYPFGYIGGEKGLLCMTTNTLRKEQDTMTTGMRFGRTQFSGRKMGVEPNLDPVPSIYITKS